MMNIRCYVCGEDSMYIAIKPNDIGKPQWAVGCTGCGTVAQEDTLTMAVNKWADNCRAECIRLLEDEVKKI